MRNSKVFEFFKISVELRTNFTSRRTFVRLRVQFVRSALFYLCPSQVPILFGKTVNNYLKGNEINEKANAWQ